MASTKATKNNNVAWKLKEITIKKDLRNMRPDTARLMNCRPDSSKIGATGLIPVRATLIISHKKEIA